MDSSVPFSNENVLNNYFRLIDLLANKRNRLSSSRTLVRLKLLNKKFLLRFYKKLIKYKFLSSLKSHIIFSYCLLKKYFINYLPWIFTSLFSIRNIAFFIYHFLVLYQAIFLLKMILDWFTVKNWDRASPFKRFLRRATIDWTRQFEDYVPSFLAWIIVINIIPILLSIIESFYIVHDLACFPASYKLDEVLEFILESNTYTFN